MLSWRTYLKSHKDRTEYDAHADCIQCIVNTAESASASHIHLMDHPTLVCLTKSNIGKEVQATFYHEKRKTSLLSSEHLNLAFLGFGSRACVVRLEPKEMFRIWNNKKIPSFEEIIRCNTLEDISNLATNESSKENILEAHAILPPLLTDALFEMEEYKADAVLLKFIYKIRSLKSEKDQQEQPNLMDPLDTSMDTEASNDSSYALMDEAELANVRMDMDTQEPLTTSEETTTPSDAQPTVTQTQEPTAFDSPEKFYELRFGRVLEFLWGVVHEEKVVKATKIVPCGSPAVTLWSDTVHERCLGMQHQPLPPFLPPAPAQHQQDVSGLSNVATAMTKLSHEMARKNELEMVTKQENEKKKSEKAFENLSKVQKNIFILITATPEDTDEDIDEMKPSEHVRTILNQKISIKAQSHLQHLFQETNNICDISIAMCTQLKNGTIASHPSVNDLNGISPFFLPERSDEERVTQELALRLEEQMALGKINDADMKTITKCRHHFPNNFGEYLHSIKNFFRLVQILAGPDSVFATKIEALVLHATKHERSYKEIEDDYWYFYASVLQYIHRRSQHFIHSASHGLVSKLKTGKLSFSDLLEDIEDGDYIPALPKWLKQSRKSSPPLKDSPSNHGADPGRPSPSGPSSKPKKKVRETIDNENIDPDLKCPPARAYREVFHPANRRGVPEVQHTDGSIRCNNWFHRGWCTKDCTLKASHSKTLTPDERTKCKEYLNKLLEKQKRWADNRRGGSHQAQG